MVTEDKQARRSDKTRLLIMRTFIGLMRVTDYPKIKVTSICESAGITRGTFYKYYSDADDLISCIENDLLSSFPCASCNNQSRIIHFPTLEDCQDDEWWQRLFSYYDKHSDTLNVLLGPHGDRSFHGRIKSRMQTELSRYMTADGFPHDSYRQYFYTILPDIYLTLAREWTSGESDNDFDQNSLSAVLNCIRTGAIYTYALKARGE